MMDNWEVCCAHSLPIVSNPVPQNVIQRSAWKLAASNRVVLNDTYNVITALQQLHTTGMAHGYDNAYEVRVVPRCMQHSTVFTRRTLGGTRS